MGDLAGNTGFSRFGSYANLGDGNMGYDWGNGGGGGVEQLDVADAPTITIPAYSDLSAIAGFLSQVRQTLFYMSRIDCIGFDVANLPIGAFIFGITIRSRSASLNTSICYHELRYDEAYLRYKGSQVGTDEGSYATAVCRVSAGTALTTQDEGGETNLWGISPFGYGKASGLSIRHRFGGFNTSTSGGPYTADRAFWLDYIFGQLSYKNTGVMMSM